jgi:hypothetical protein
MGRSTGYENDCTLRHDTGARSDRRGVHTYAYFRLYIFCHGTVHDGSSFVSCCIAERAEREIERTKCI